MFRCLENKNSLENDSDEQNGSIISALVVAQRKSMILINNRFESRLAHSLSILNSASFSQAPHGTGLHLNFPWTCLPRLNKFDITRFTQRNRCNNLERNYSPAMSFGFFLRSSATIPNWGYSVTLKTFLKTYSGYVIPNSAQTLSVRITKNIAQVKVQIRFSFLYSKKNSSQKNSEVNQVS